MFEDVFIESRKRPGAGRRGTATLTAFLIQVVVIAILVLIPLIFIQALPTPTNLVTELTAPPPPPPPPPPAAAKVQPVQPQPVVKESQLTAPVKIPQKVAMVKDVQNQPAAAPSAAGVVGGVPGGQIGGVVGGVLNSVGTAAPKLVAPQRIRVSQGVSNGMLQHKVMPEYPAMARQSHLQGTVVLSALIGKDGKINNVKVVSGHPMLAESAVKAVKQWRYKPYVLNGQPVEVETTINVNFNMSGATS